MKLVVTIPEVVKEFELGEEEAQEFRECPEDEKDLFMDYYLSKAHNDIEMEWEVID